MRLRTRLLLPISFAMVAGVTVVALGTAAMAGHELMEAAKRRLAQASYLLATQSEGWFDAFASTLNGWAANPQVEAVFLQPDNPDIIAESNTYFQELVARTPVLQTVNLLALDARCLAASIPTRVGLEEMQNVVRDRSDFISARNGTTGFSGALWGLATHRPIIAVSVPVYSRGAIVGVLRSVVDLGFYNERYLEKLLTGLSGRAYVFDPEMKLKEEAYLKVWDIITDRPYTLPIESPPDLMREEDAGFFIHGKGRERCLAAFQHARVPDWVFVVEESMSAIYRPIRLIFSVAGAVVLFIFVAVWVAVRQAVHPVIQGIEQCAKRAQDIGRGTLEGRLPTHSIAEIGCLTDGLNRMAENLEEQRERLAVAEQDRRKLDEAEKLVARTELHMLRLQMNPHFLFNALNSIEALVTRDAEGARRMIHQLAAFCRASLLVKEDGMSTVGDEINLVKQYLAIEQVRWGASLKVTFQVDESLKDIPFPAFILQPVADNAVKYGQLSGADPLFVRVTAERHGQNLYLEVANVGRWFPNGGPADQSLRVGLSSVVQRLKNLYGERCCLEKSESDGWVRVSLELREAAA